MGRPSRRRRCGCGRPSSPASAPQVTPATLCRARSRGQPGRAPARLRRHRSILSRARSLTAPLQEKRRTTLTKEKAMKKRLKDRVRVKKETLRQLTPVEDKEAKKVQGGVLCSKCATTCLACRIGTSG